MEVLPNIMLNFQNNNLYSFKILYENKPGDLF